ncbi:PilW family protein [Candidatus Clostridium stratigraminis]|uniref:PilW family protein n=1 Tax=Candidatus Clostridium stratigraminis TaxID=3381661 RepID=A0ABW8T2C0_9CLOT
MKLITESKKGLTLLELIITIAILSIVLTGIYSLFGVGNTTFIRGTRQSDIQSSIRLASDYITQQIRYSTEIKILDDAAIPPLSDIQPYENYIYFDSTNNTITHINKYFTKTISIVHPGSIEFTSLSPFKLLKFNIRAENRGQSYNINSEVISMNLHLNAGGTITGTTGTTSLKTERDAIYFKTATDYMAILLKPVAEELTINTENNLGISFGREITNVEIVSSVGVTNPKSVITGTKTVAISSNSTLDGAQVIFRVTFGGTESYGNTYDYTVKYNSSTKWNMQ